MSRLSFCLSPLLALLFCLLSVLFLALLSSPFSVSLSFFHLSVFSLSLSLSLYLSPFLRVSLASLVHFALPRFSLLFALCFSLLFFFFSIIFSSLLSSCLFFHSCILSSFTLSLLFLCPSLSLCIYSLFLLLFLFCLLVVLLFFFLSLSLSLSLVVSVTLLLPARLQWLEKRT